MADGTVIFPGIQAVKSFSFGYSAHGIAPSIAKLDIAPQQDPVQLVGHLSLMFRGQRVEVFRDCRIDDGSYTRGPDGRVVSVRLLDGRWKWKFGSISGWYNQKDEGGELIPELERTPQELAILLLQAMRVDGFDVQQLPNLARPPVDWSEETPAVALEQLCSQLGCRIVVQPYGTVTIWPIGIGSLLPINNDLMDAQDTVDVQETADSVRVVGAPTIVQAKLALKPVGQELSGDSAGAFVHVDDLTYNPKGQGVKDGFKGQGLSFGGVDDDLENKYAQRFVWKAYQIDLDTPVDVPNIGKVSDLRQILPILQELNETGFDEKTKKYGKLSPQVHGIFLRFDGTEDGNSEEDERYTGDFTVDGPRGIVFFNEPVTRLSGDDLTHATLYLTCAFSVRDDRQGHWHRFTHERQSPVAPQGTGAMIIKRDELVLEVTGSGLRPGSLSWTNNEADKNLRGQADYYINATFNTFQPTRAGSGKYTGFQRVRFDGSIQQATYQTNEGGCTTTVSVNTETNPAVPSYGERVERARLQAIRSNGDAARDIQRQQIRARR